VVTLLAELDMHVMNGRAKTFSCYSDSSEYSYNCRLARFSIPCCLVLITFGLNFLILNLLNSSSRIELFTYVDILNLEHINII
jgi:hypothetical protein